MKKVLVIVVSIILVVGVAIGLVAHQHYKRNNSSIVAFLSSTNKVVASICIPTDYKQACVDSMRSLAHNASASPIDFLTVAISAAVEEVKTVKENLASFIGKAAADETVNRNRLEDCNELLQYPIDELQASIYTAGDMTVKDREAELMNCLSAVVSYQETCIDGFNDTPELRAAMSNSLFNATKLTSNALAIVADIFKAFKIDNHNPPVATTHRRLLFDTNNGFPVWVSTADRKLLVSNNTLVTPDAVVAKDVSGQFKTITEALRAYKLKSKNGRYVMYIKEGIYDEYITVTKDQVNVYMYGDGPDKTIVTGKKSYAAGWATFKTASFSAIGSGFVAKSMGFRNTAGPEGQQAVALRVQSDMSAFYNVRIDGYQDTLYTQTHRQFYRNSVISGTIDFIFGDASAIIQNCVIVCRLPAPGQKITITAQGRKIKQETTGLVIQNSRIVPEKKLYPMRFEVESYLGRPWKEYARTVVMESMLGDLIRPEGWLPWDGAFALDTCFYGEYGNRGPGAPTNRRVKWKGFKVITDRNEAMQYTVKTFIQGNQWLTYTGVPFYLGLEQP